MTISTIGTGGTYSTIQAWEDACPANITAGGTNENWEGELKNQLFTSTSALLTVSGTTTDATHRLILRCEAGASFRDNAGAAANPLTTDSTKGALIRCTGTYAIGINAISTNITFYGLQIEHSNKIKTAISLRGDTIVDSCIIAGAIKKDQTIFSDCINTVVLSGAVQQVGGFNFKNCTFVAMNTAINFAQATYGWVSNYTNCLFIGFTKVENSATNTSFTSCVTTGTSFATTQTLTSCITSVTAANEIVSATITSYSTVDARIKTGAQSVGSGTSTGTPSVDIIGQTRS
jgi:hypothetical protein